MRRTLIIAATVMLAACSSNSGNQTETPDQTSAMPNEQMQPAQQEKTNDVKTEAAGEHFQNGMSEPDKLMQTAQKEAPTSMQQATEPEAAPAQTTSPATVTQQAMEPTKKAMEAAAPPSTEMAAKVIGTTWKRCAACHNFTDKPKVGPGLAKVVGRKAGSMSNFHYKFAQYIKGKGWTWDEAHLRKWMCNSKEAIKEFTGNPDAQTKMPVQHICKPEDQESVLSKLKSIS